MQTASGTSKNTACTSYPKLFAILIHCRRSCGTQVGRVHVVPRHLRNQPRPQQAPQRRKHQPLVPLVGDVVKEQRPQQIARKRRHPAALVPGRLARARETNRQNHVSLGRLRRGQLRRRRPQALRLRLHLDLCALPGEPRASAPPAPDPAPRLWAAPEASRCLPAELRSPASPPTPPLATALDRDTKVSVGPAGSKEAPDRLLPVDSDSLGPRLGRRLIVLLIHSRRSRIPHL